MTEQDLSNLIKEKIAVERHKLPVHEYMTLKTNGRGISDAGEFYNKVLDDTLDIVQKVAVIGFISSAIRNKG